MAIKDSPNPLAISEIVAEFGDAAGGSDSLSEYRAGGQNVPSGTQNGAGQAIPSSGAIAIGQFFGASNRAVIGITISSSTQGYNTYSNRGDCYAAGSSDLTYTVNPGVVVGSDGTSAAMLVPSQFNASDTVTILNRGKILGTGVTGGAGGTCPPSAPGQAGGNAINIQRNITVQNAQGLIGGGGGGGGAGGFCSFAVSVKNPQPSGNAAGGGGGGGAGQVAGQGGAGAPGTGGGLQTDPHPGSGISQAGQNGSCSAGGNGGLGGSVPHCTPYQGAQGCKGAGGGGAGGGLGQAGQGGQHSGVSGQPSQGGAAGKAINLNSNCVTFTDGNCSCKVKGAVS